MSYKIVTNFLVKNDLKSAISYYHKISPKLSKRFIDEIEVGKNFISEFPFANDIAYDEIRLHLICIFPYHIHYFIDALENKVVILAICFGKKEDLDFSKRMEK
jgi:plasmid stabilization system protein ParE